MKMKFTFAVLFAAGSMAFSQAPVLADDIVEDGKPLFAETIVQQAESFSITPALSDLPCTHNEPKQYEGTNKRRRHKFVNPNALPQGEDPIWQKENGKAPSRAPIANFNGASSSSMPNDPSGSVGPNHYFHAINTEYQIFDKSGNSLYGPSNLGSLWAGSGNNGDPIVMYDEAADRWFISQFGSQSDNKMYIAVSKTNDPLGQYYTWTYTFSQFPDYMKYSIWHDGYYMTANMQGQNFTVFERDKMLAGDASARMIAKTQSVPANGFYCAMSAYVDGTHPPAGTPQYFFALTDDGWGGVSDGVRIYKMTTDWTAGTATVTQSQDVALSAFDSAFTSSWDDITQKGSTQKLDGLVGFLMYRANYRRFATHNSLLLCFTVDLNGSDHAGIRWVELRQADDSSNWTLYQEGTYGPDALNRWCPSISIDKQGNIGLGYAVAGSTAYPSIRYTGRKASDPLGTLTVAETVAVDGTGAITGANRFGDYGQMSVDPDGLTFWHTCEYGTSSGRKARVYSFQIGTASTCDVGVSAVTNPTNGTLTNAENISVTISNFGSDSQSNITVSYAINGGTAVTETYTGTITGGASATYTFTQTADMSAQGTYSVVATATIGCDEDNSNDSFTQAVEHLSANNVGVSALTAPTTGTGLTATETVTVTVNNYGSAAASNFPVSYTVNGGTAVTETYTGSIASGASASYSFTQTADLSTIGNYAFKAYTDMTNDSDRSNDTTAMSVGHTNCQPQADCSYGDGFTNFKLTGYNGSTINQASGCGTNGYEDYTSVSCDIRQGDTYTFEFQSGYTEQKATIWIDFNDNFVFEASEEIVTNFAFDNSGTTTFTLANDAPVGEHLMRARTNWQSDSNDACANYQYGETEDYKVNVLVINVGVEEMSNNLNMNISTVANGQYLVSVTNPSDDFSLEVYNTVGQLVYTKQVQNNGGEVNENIDLTEFAAGAFMIKVANEAATKVEKVIYKK